MFPLGQLSFGSASFAHHSGGSYLSKHKTADDIAWDKTGKETPMLAKFCQLSSRMKENDPKLVLFAAHKMAGSKALAASATE